MNTNKTLFYTLSALFISNLLFAPTIVQAQDYEEVSYEDLVKELNSKVKSKVRYGNTSNDPFSLLKVHVGLGLINSVNSIQAGGQDKLKFREGIEISLGLDLVDESIAIETSVRNFGNGQSDSADSFTLREFAVKGLFKQKASQSLGYRVIAGMGARYLRYDDYTRGISISDSTPTSILGAGFDAYINKGLSVGLDLTGRTAMIGETADKNSLAMSLRVDSHF